jgi:hypothetical protein
MTYKDMMAAKPPKCRVNKTWLWLFVLLGAVFSFVFGDQISAFEDHVLTVLFGK